MAVRAGSNREQLVVWDAERIERLDLEAVSQKGIIPMGSGKNLGLSVAAESGNAEELMNLDWKSWLQLRFIDPL